MAYGDIPKMKSAPNTAPNKQIAGSGADASLTLTLKSQQEVSKQLLADLLTFPVTDLRNKYTLLDLAYNMEAAVRSDEEKQEINFKMRQIYKDIELPILQPNIDAAHAYLVGVFLGGEPLFGIVTEDPKKAAAAKQMESIIWENSKTAGWGRQLNMWFKSALKYNVSAIDVDWIVRRTFNPITDTSKSLTRATTQEIFRGGNELRALDMYNTFFDTTKHPADVHTGGDFSGWCERLTLMQLYELITTIKVNGGMTMNIDDKLWCSSPKHNFYYYPQIVTVGQVARDPGWLGFLTGNLSPVRYGNMQKYEVMHYTRRIIPSMLGINNVPDKDSVQIWKFIEVNGIVIYAERKSNAHNLFSTLYCQPIEDNLGLQTKGPAQNLLNFQNLAGSMFRARMASLARNISDRGIYDPTRIATKDINSTNPAAKIPVRPGAFGSKLEDAYRPIPFDDRGTAGIYQDIGQVMNWSQDAAHVNRAQRGQFTKGNRTQAEYEDVMENADASQQAMARLIEDQAMVNIKHIIKVNVLQYQSAAQLPHPNTKEVIEVNPAELRNAILDFKVADGLISKEKLMSIDATLEAFQIMSQIPAPPPEDTTTPRYDIVGMLVHTLEQKGAKLSNFRIQAPPPAAPPAQAPAQQVPGIPATT